MKDQFNAEFGDVVRCKFCNGKGYESSRYWDDMTGGYEVMETKCGGCGGNGERVYHEETEMIDYLETRYDDGPGW